MAKVSVAQKWVLMAERSVSWPVFQLHISFRVHPLLPASPSVCCVPITVGATSHARYKPSGPSSLSILSTANLSDHQCGRGGLEAEADRHRVEGRTAWHPGCWGFGLQSGL